MKNNTTPRINRRRGLSNSFLRIDSCRYAFLVFLYDSKVCKIMESFKTLHNKEGGLMCVGL